LKTVVRVKVNGFVDVGVAPELVLMPPVTVHCICDCEVCIEMVGGKVKVILLNLGMVMDGVMLKVYVVG